MANETIDLNEQNGDSLVATAIVFLTLSWISVGLRTYTRTFLIHGLQIDDWLMLTSQIIFTISCAFILLGVRDGVGRHNDAITDEDEEVAALKWQALATATYVLDMMFIKLSIGIFLLRLSVEKVYIWILRVSLAIVTIWSTVIFFWDIFQCTPVQKQWDFRIEEGRCVTAAQIVSAAYSISVMTILTDWLYALLPIPMLWKVKMTKQAKWTVIAILGLGIFASVATLIRLKFLADLENTDDILFAGTDAMVWTLVEPGVAIVASSLATIRPLLRAMKIRGFESTEHSYGTGWSTGPSSKRRSGPPTANNTILMSRGHAGASFADVELELEESRPGADSKNIGITLVDQNKSLPALPLAPSLQKPAVYVAGDQTSTPASPWQPRRSSSSRNSLEQIHDLEAQKENPRFGLGRR